MFARPTVMLLLAGWFLAVAVGLPLEVRLPATKVVDSSEAERFPCETCPCGCATADHCWKKCCCHSLASRLAWARREGVRPPQYAIAAAEAAGFDMTCWNGTPGSSRLAQDSSMGDKDVQQRTSFSKKMHHDESTPKARSLTFKPVVVLHAIACQGMTNDGTLLVATPPPAVVALPARLGVSEFLMTKAWLYAALVGEPPFPPPQLAATKLS